MPLPSSRRFVALGTTIASGALLVATLDATTIPTAAAPGPTDPIRSFNATVASTGAIPDGPDTGGTCATNFPAIKEVLIPVSGVTGPLSDVRITVALEHDKIGDIGMALEAPDGTRAGVINRIGADRVGCGDDSGFNGNYTFFDGAQGNMAAIAASVDSTRDLGSGGYFPSTASGQVIPLTSPFVNANPNGTWKLFIADYQAGVVGRVYSATLRLASVDKAASAACQSAKAAAKDASRSAKRAAAKFQDARAAVKSAERRRAPKAVIKRLSAKKARLGTKERAAAAASSQARTNRANACG